MASHSTSKVPHTRWRPELILSFQDSESQAQALAQRLDLPCDTVDVHYFPDQECKVRVARTAACVAIYRPLNHPNAKLIELILCASALRDLGATEITLIAPYLPYMRQDIAFQPGEAVSQKVIGTLLAQTFDRFVTVDPHLHRTPNLADVFQGKPSLALSGTSAIASALKDQNIPNDALVLGPDEESETITRAVAEPLTLAWATCLKTRHGDRDVRITLPPQTRFESRNVIIVDDVISSGATVAHLADLLQAAGAATIDVYATHALFNAEASAAMKHAGVRRIVSCDGVHHASNGMSIVDVIATGLNTWL